MPKVPWKSLRVHGDFPGYNALSPFLLSPTPVGGKCEGFVGFLKKQNKTKQKC